jgi:hypothetical protein
MPLEAAWGEGLVIFLSLQEVTPCAARECHVAKFQWSCRTIEFDPIDPATRLQVWCDRVQLTHGVLR